MRRAKEIDERVDAIPMLERNGAARNALAKDY